MMRFFLFSHFGLSSARHGNTTSSKDGFTLLEVLIALALVSTVALLAVQASGTAQEQVALTRWYDEVGRLGRNKMVLLLRSGKDNLHQWGTLAPEYPDVRWRSELVTLQGGTFRGGTFQGGKGQRLVFRLEEGEGATLRTLVFDYVFPQ